MTQLYVIVRESIMSKSGKRSVVQEIKELDLTTHEGIATALSLSKATRNGAGFGIRLNGGSTTGMVINKSVASDEEGDSLQVADEVEEVAEEASGDRSTESDEDGDRDTENSGNETSSPDITSILQSVLNEARQVREQNQSLSAEVEEQRRRADQAEQRAQEAGDAQRIVEDLGRLAGSSMAGVESVSRGATTVNVNTVSGRGDKLTGAVREWRSIFEQSTPYSKMRSDGRAFSTCDYDQIRQFVREERRALIRDLESYGKNLGLFRGSKTIQSSGTQLRDFTQASDIVGGFLPILSSIMRENNRPGYIFHQFINYTLDPSKAEGDTIKVQRAAFQPKAGNRDDRLLSGNGQYVRIDPGAQAISTGTVNSIIKEWGLGRNSNAAPIGLTNFVLAYSMTQLLPILDRNLWQDYISWEDLTIRSLWTPSSRVIYNKAGNVTTNPASIAAGEDGSFTEDFVYSTGYYMAELEIPPLVDECYGMAVPTSYLKTLRKSLDDKLEAPTKAQLDEITNLLNAMTGGHVDKASGYQGKIGNCHIWASNAFSKGAPGTEGVNTETIGGSPQETREGFVFGDLTIGSGIGSEYEIRFDDDTDFQRMRRAIWHKESSYTAVDVDPVGYQDTSEVPQQLRVAKMRCTASAV